MLALGSAARYRRLHRGEGSQPRPQVWCHGQASGATSDARKVAASAEDGLTSDGVDGTQILSAGWSLVELGDARKVEGGLPLRRRSINNSMNPSSTPRYRAWRSAWFFRLSRSPQVPRSALPGGPMTSSGISRPSPSSSIASPIRLGLRQAGDRELHVRVQLNPLRRDGPLRIATDDELPPIEHRERYDKSTARPRPRGIE
jgi:hypothetical protein